ncbi:MAG: hypothetical protein JNL11_13850 [Bdellovibrionaceae bacterium]|nr:hypothetical protein [Pseudobdellovibrionaceae bacterium]
MFSFGLIFVIGSILVGCTTGQIIEKKEYIPAVASLKMESPALALQHFPKKEANHFIPLVEKVYLQLIDDANTITKDSKDTAEFTQLLRESRQIEQNEMTSITNELSQLLFIKTDEGYYPGNHEIFWMHFVLGLTFIKKNKMNEARVEAKRISELFARVGMNGKPFYDNAGVRILSAVLWSLCGEKENAIVDLRKAQAMGGFVDANRYENKPLNWEVLFKGTGVVATTDDKLAALQGVGFHALEFKSEVPSKDVDVPDLEKSKKFVFSSKSWHTENLARNEAFKETIQSSKYMSRMFVSELEFQSLNFLTSAATGVVLVTGIAVGVGIVGGGIYLASQISGSGEAIGQIIAIGLIAGTEIYNSGLNFYKTTQSRIKTQRTEFQDVSRFYRYVRFIPDYFVLDTELIKSTNMIPFLQLENSSGKIKLFFQP